MSVRKNQLNDTEKILNENGTEEEQVHVCSFKKDELEDMCSSWQADTCGDGLLSKPS